MVRLLVAFLSGSGMSPLDGVSAFFVTLWRLDVWTIKTALGLFVFSQVSWEDL